MEPVKAKYSASAEYGVNSSLGVCLSKTLNKNTFFEVLRNYRGANMEHLTESNFKEKTAKGNVIVDFWAEWCGPCKMIGPIFEELSKEMKDIAFTKLNVDENGEIAGEHGVRGIPTMILFTDGKEVGRIVGFMPKEALKSKIESTFNN